MTDLVYLSNDEAVLEQDGIFFTVLNGTIDQEEADHVLDFHAGKFCPVMLATYGCSACELNAIYGSQGHMCHDPGLAGTW